MIGNTLFLLNKQAHTNEAPTNKGSSPYVHTSIAWLDTNKHYTSTTTTTNTNNNDKW